VASFESETFCGQRERILSRRDSTILADAKPCETLNLRRFRGSNRHASFFKGNLIMRFPIARYAVLAVLLIGTVAARAQPDMSAPQVFEALRQGRILVIDLRTPQEWRQTGVVPGAGRVDFYRGPEVLLSSVLQMVGGDRSAPIALVCRTGNRTSHAQKFLQAQGFTQVYNLKEGMSGSAAGPGWLKRRLPVEPCTRC
jgi:rhodanese-related sulfurtransferase